jgi:hypothetical protein
VFLDDFALDGAMIPCEWSTKGEGEKAEVHDFLYFPPSCESQLGAAPSQRRLALSQDPQRLLGPRVENPGHDRGAT